MDWILIVYISLIFVSLWGRNKKVDYLSVETSTNMRGIAAIGIVLHHMSEKTASGHFFGYLEMTGYLFVAFFFFLSGYGLLVQYQKKKEDYINDFFKKRILYIIIIYLLDIVLYSVADFLMGIKYTFWQIFKSIFVSGIAKNSWYITVLILFYIVFYVVFKWKAIKTIPQKIICVFAVQVVFVVFCLIIKAESFWYLSNFGFTMGMLWAYNKEKIDKWLNNRYFLVLCCLVIITAVLYLIPILSDRYIQANAAFCTRTVFRMISPLALVAITMLIDFKLKPSLFLWKWLGGISLEIYLIHGLVYTFLRSNFVYLESEVLWTTLTVLISIILAYPINLLNKRILKLLNH